MIDGENTTILDAEKAPPIAGYRKLTDAEMDAVNLNKKMEEQVLLSLDALKTDKSIDQRWLNIGRTHIEQGFMAINRSITKPTRVSL